MESIYTLIERAQTGDSIAKEEIMRENSGLIWSVVKRFYGRGEPEDLYQIGAIGLLKCIDKFDFSFDVKFSTYAVPMIMGEIKRFLRDDGAVKVSRSIRELAYRARKVQEEFVIKEAREPTMTELSQLLNEEKENVVVALESIKEVQSLNSVEKNVDTYRKMQWIDQLRVPSEDEKILDSIFLQKALNSLSEKERQVIILRYFQDKTQMEVAQKIGISQVQVSRMEKRILLQLRSLLQ
ncbi:MAG: SigB/SigF/SigG family RNA polymerase sigma factor [Anaerotignum sp.]|nr:SigB/SigF/SigG family RNA polymerase sigma factor [Anaerotignum sp.]